MYYPRLYQVKHKIENVVNNPGDGINTYGTSLSIKPSEAIKSLNLCSRQYPSLCVRAGRQEHTECLTSPNALGERNNESIHVQDGMVWKRWTGAVWEDIRNELTSRKGKIADFVRGTDRNTILMNGVDRCSWDGTTVTDLDEAPLTDKFTIHKGRIYALTGTTMKYSALNKINDWTTANDSGTIELTNAKGPGTGIVTYGDYVTIFTEFSMHQIYGTGPSNYQLIDIADNIGCISDRSIVTYKKLLLFVSFDGIYSFGGGDVEKISQKMDGYFKGINLNLRSSIVGGILEDTAFFSIPSKPDSTSNDLIIKYNISKGIWNTESGSILDFVTIGNRLYGVDNNGKLWDMISGTKDGLEQIYWNWESGPRFAKPSAKQTLSNLWVLYDLPVGSTLNVYVSNSLDNDDWILNNELSDHEDEQISRLKIPINRINDVNWYRLKFTGTGPCTIHAIEEQYRVRE